MVKARHNSAPVDLPLEALTPKELSKQEFGRRLSQYMLSRNMNQSDLARAADLGRDSISTYVNGRTFPTPKALEKLARALGVTPQELLPNAMIAAMEAEHPALELRQAAGHPDKAWLRVNRAMSFETAAKIIALINEEDSKG